jgi:integrase
VSIPTIAATPAESLSYQLDHDAWVQHLQAALVPQGEWRTGEFDPARWLFTGNPDNPATTSTRCKVRACDTVVTSRRMCNQCRRAWDESGLAAETFVATYRPSLTRRRRAERRVVECDGVGCQRRRLSNRTGLCHGHTNHWKRQGKRTGLTLKRWSTEAARPLPAREPCSVLGCLADSKLDSRLCGSHFGSWQRGQRGKPDDQCETVEHWAQRQPPPQLQVHQFDLSGLAPTVRWELLYALQQRDMQGQKLDPKAMRLLVAAFADLDAVATTPYAQVQQRLGKTRSAHAYARMLTRVIHLKFEEFRGIRHTDKDVWDCLALDLETPRPGKRPNLTTIDFTPIHQRWLRDAAKEWVRTFRPADTGQLGRTVQACTLASQALMLRPGGGHEQRELRYADMTAVFETIKKATGTTGKLYDARYRRGLWARFHDVLDIGRKTELLPDLPGAFSRHPSQRIGQVEVNEDEIGKAIPETVIAQLDRHLDLLGTDRTYGHAWSPTDTTTMFRTTYLVLRDTGRRPGEVVSLHADCLEYTDGEYSLIYDNHKKKRLRRRLPIATETAAVIQEWQQYRAGLDLPASTLSWLFPAWGESSGPGHLSTNRLVRAFKGWAAAIPTLHSDLPGPDGTPQPFDRSLIHPASFRHSYAQRHADAGVAVEVLKELMNHKDINVTQGYYTISLKRKREAITIMSRYVHDRTGTPTSASDSATAYELKSVAVPFGNCIEPSNVKAGGHGCPIRFQCAGCGFYRPDPSYLPAIEEHINALKADRETALAMDADDFVVRNLADQAGAFSQVAVSMRDKLNSLPEAERAEVEAASAILRKVRAGRDLAAGRTLLPLSVTDPP